MLNRLRAFRERGWREVDAPTYAQAWQRFGGSVATHPLVVEQLAEMAGIPVRYLGWESAGELVAAIPTWGRHLALSEDVLKRRGKKGLYDLGNAELILPVADDARIALRHAGRYLSALHERNIVTLRPQTEQLAFARAPEDFSRSSAITSGAKCAWWRRPVARCARQTASPRPSSLPSILNCSSVAGFPATGAERMAEVFERLRELLRGSVLLLNDQPIAVQVLYRAEAPGWLSVEYINGGVDPQTREFSPGSVLSYLNTQAAWEDARALGKPLRYSFGRADREYRIAGAILLGLPGLKHERTQAAVAQASSTQQADRPTGCAAGIAGRRSAGQPLVVADPPRGPVGRPTKPGSPITCSIRRARTTATVSRKGSSRCRYAWRMAVCESTVSCAKAIRWCLASACALAGWGASSNPRCCWKVARRPMPRLSNVG